MNSKIPKRIIQTDKSPDLPLLSRAAVSSIRLHNPDFEYLFFDDQQVEGFIDTEFPEYRSVFDSFPFPIQRYDFFRYLAIYRLGGFYFDTDVILASNLSALLNFNCIFPFEGLTINRFLRNRCGMDWEIGNYAFGAAAGDPFLHAIIQNCIKAQEDPEWAKVMLRSIPRLFRNEFFVLYTTGPGLISRTLSEYPDAKWVKILFPQNVCDRNSWHLFGHYGLHLMMGTWRKRPSNLKRRFLSWWWLREENKVLNATRKAGDIKPLEFDYRT